MQGIYYLIKGLIIGISIAAPVGPIGILYGAIAGFGLTFLSNFLIGQQIWLRLIGGGLLCLIGVKTFLSKPVEQRASLEGNSLWSAYLSTFFLTVTNPMTILFFAAVFAGLGVGNASDHYVSAGILVLGVFIGSASWWLILSGFTGLLRGMLNSKRLQWLNRISGLIIIGFGLAAFLSLMR
jgi:threonine/homoserine/homoserine lactone efflux protein